MLAWADRELEARRTVCMIHPDNHNSLTLAGRLGYRHFADTRYRARPAVLLERLAANSG
jgi:RimJ/RimL family protein N-acetyltransferase